MKKVSRNQFNPRFFILLIISFLFSCDNNDGTARLQVSLVDAPGDYQEVNIDIEDVMVNTGTDDNGYSSLEGANSGVLDVLELTAGIEAVLADAEIPAGKLSQIRLVLGDNNTLKIDGSVVDLTIPSGSESGLKLKVNMDLEDGITYKILLDFDAAKSVVKTGSSGKYNLKPIAS